MDSQLIATKLFSPPLRPGLLPRRRLTGLLEDALKQGRNLILVSAPAGFGKSVLVADWLAQRQIDNTTPGAVWLSLDDHDNEPLTFWRYVIAALGMVDPSIGRAMDAALFAAQEQRARQAAIEPLLSGLINDLAAAAARVSPFILVLDDYHVIEAEAIHASLNFFIEHLPIQVVLVIITRVDPPLALARRRARAQLAEVRVNELRFTLAETTAFLKSAGLFLADEDVSSLENRTEGWVVGLQLAALSLRECSDPHAFIAAFAGDNRYVVDYLLEEVLLRLPLEIHDFILKTSILERFCAGLCEEVVRVTGKNGQPSSQAMLDFLENANLFMIPLDSRRRWYRYHHLFADLLRRRLRQSMSSAGVLELYHRACAWYEREGYPSEAINQALSAPDYDYAAGLMERHVLTFFYRSEGGMVDDWLKKLPEDLLRSRPLLCAVRACLIALSPPYPPESTRAAEHWLEQAEQALRDAGPDQDITRAFISNFRAYLSRFKQDPAPVVIALTRQALDSLPSEEAGQTGQDINFLRFRSALMVNLGFVYLTQGDVDGALHAFSEARRIGLKCGDFFNACSAVNCQAVITMMYGRLPEAFAVCQDFLHIIEDAGQKLLTPVPYASQLGITMGAILLEWDQVEAAERLLLKNMELAEISAGNTSLHTGCLALSRLALSRGEGRQALALIDRADQNWGGSVRRSEGRRARTWAALGDDDPAYRQEAIRWSEQRALIPFNANPIAINKEDSLALARVLIAAYGWRGRSDLPGRPSLNDLLAWLDQQRQAAEEYGWLHWIIQVRLLEALACQALKDRPGALAAMRDALRLAEPGGYIRLFAEEGAHLAGLLESIAGECGKISVYARKILSAIRPGAETRTGGPAEEKTPAPRRLEMEQYVEPLSGREMEVLRLLAKGASNAEIAQALVVAPSTAKKHVIHILGKLGVSSRSKAVSKARELGLIDG